MAEKANRCHPDGDRDCVIRLGISTCLLGENVRYDGGHKLDRFLVYTLGQYVEWVPVCPEVEIGLPIPRETMRLVGDAEAPRLVALKSGQDYTERMQTWARGRLEELAQVKLHGFVFKKDSPSSGLYRVKVYTEQGMPSKIGTGIFPREVMKRFPLLPLEEEGRLHDMHLRENFIDRIFAYYRWMNLLEENPTPGGLVKFHTAHKLTLMAHSPPHYQHMGKLVAQAGSLPWEEVTEKYARSLMDGLEVMTSSGKHTNVLQHLMGFLKDDLPGEEKAELLYHIEDYRNGLVPLVVPLTLLKHHLSRHQVPDWVHQQVYLYPYPKELLLRNHV
ncbi:MAG: DUF523 and DUF1722 domain-containing protein [Chloroflexota bacterium]|nr:DUF523 and DUF1722 domain-containing protein [Chloroflexota bacterium]